MSARTDPPQAAAEREQLLGFLQYQRDTLRLKAGGLDAGQLATALPPSDLTLGGMVKHLALVEHWWIRCVLLGEEYAEPWASVDWDADPDWDWHSAADDRPQEIWDLYDRTVADTDPVIRSTGLDALSVRPGRRTGEPFNLRWILLHLVEEYARHNGHADLIRQSIDGATGQ